VAAFRLRRAVGLTFDRRRRGRGGRLYWPAILELGDRIMLSGGPPVANADAYTPGRSICVRVFKNHHIDLLSSPRHSGYTGNATRVLAAPCTIWTRAGIRGPEIFFGNIVVPHLSNIRARSRSYFPLTCRELQKAGWTLHR
jgi:hypothetical protein